MPLTLDELNKTIAEQDTARAAYNASIEADRIKMYNEHPITREIYQALAVPGIPGATLPIRILNGLARLKDVYDIGNAINNEYNIIPNANANTPQGLANIRR